MIRIRKHGELAPSADPSMMDGPSLLLEDLGDIRMDLRRLHEAAEDDGERLARLENTVEILNRLQTNKRSERLVTATYVGGFMGALVVIAVELGRLLLHWP